MIQFTKLHGNGNDFIVIDEFKREIVPEGNKPLFAQQFCHRRFGIGGDGVLFLSESTNADLRMRLFQPDRSEAEMCGNGIRCLAKYAYDTGYITEGTSTIDTLAGIIPLDVRDRDGQVWVKVNMGKPLFGRQDIPAEGKGDFINEMLDGMRVSAVNTGVPHAVIFVEDLEGTDIDSLAPPIRYHSIFPKGTNVNFAKISRDGKLNVRTYERGIEGETLSCGTGSVASAVIAHRLGFLGDSITVHTQGGILNITIEGGYAFMEGTAITVFKGTII